MNIDYLFHYIYVKLCVRYEEISLGFFTYKFDTRQIFYIGISDKTFKIVID